MKCFRHHDEDAVGICKVCSKGLCNRCAIDLGRGLACKESCEKGVININWQSQANDNALFIRPAASAIGVIITLAAAACLGPMTSMFSVLFSLSSLMFATMAVWDVILILSARKSTLLGTLSEQHEVDHLDHEFEKLESDLKEKKKID